MRQFGATDEMARWVQPPVGMKPIFRRTLLAKILSVTLGPAAAFTACALIGCGGGDATSDETLPTGADQPSELCFAWPSATGDHSTCSDGGGSAGEAGFCPTVNEAPKYLPGCGQYNSIERGSVKQGQCCYLVSFGSGRPLVIEERARTAAPMARMDWSMPVRAPARGDLSRESRARLARGWANDALLEHASVASFSLLALDLLALGAPADLVEAAHAAALDEVRHARICFALATAYAGSAPCGPSALPELRAARPSGDLRALAASTMRDGCIGETLAACELDERARVSAGSLRRVLGEIARDEARHAALAWRIVAWAVEMGGQDVADAAKSAMEEAVRAIRGAPLEAQAAIPTHGQLEASDLAAAREAALVEVILPAARALFG